MYLSSQPRRPHCRPHYARRLALATTAPLILASLAGFAARPASAQTYGALTTLVNFNGGLNGSGPQGDLTFDSSGNLYGTTVTLAAPATTAPCTRSRQARTRSPRSPALAGGVNGANPGGNVVFDSGGNLYGVATERWLQQRWRGVPNRGGYEHG